MSGTPAGRSGAAGSHGTHTTSVSPKTAPTLITDARSAASLEMASRQKRYAITMAFRTACFISMIFVPGNLRWVLFAGAVFLPYVAVLFANQANTKTVATEIPRGEPTAAQQLTSGATDLPDVIPGTVVDDEPEQGEHRRDEDERHRA